MKFAHTSLFVKDVLQSVAFYEKAFGMKKRFIHESGQFAEMESDEAVLHFAASEPVIPNPLGLTQERAIPKPTSDNGSMP